MKKYYEILLYFLLLALILPCSALAQYDFNYNGSNEFIFTTTVDGELHWYAQDPYTDELFSLGTFGVES
jgi:hypothetical protein